MQRCRAGLLRAGQNELQPLDLSRLGPPHRHESRTASRIAQSISQKNGHTDIVDLFCNAQVRFPVLVAMAAALKVFARGTLTFFEIAVVVLFIASLAVLAALGCLWTLSDELEGVRK